MRQRSAALRAQHPEAVCVVDDEPGIEALGQREHCAQVGEVSVHAEDRIGDDQLDRCRAALQLARQNLQVAVRETLHRRLREQGAIDQRSMVELVGEDRRAGVAQRGEQRDVRHVAGAEEQRLRVRHAGRLKCREVLFQRGVRPRVAADQMRCTAARAIAPCALGQGFDQRRMVRQTQVVVAAEGQHLPFGAARGTDALVRRTRRFGDAASASQRLRVALAQLPAQVFDQHGSRPGGSSRRPRRCQSTLPSMMDLHGCCRRLEHMQLLFTGSAMVVANRAKLGRQARFSKASTGSGWPPRYHGSSHSDASAPL